MNSKPLATKAYQLLVHGVGVDEISRELLVGPLAELAVDDPGTLAAVALARPLGLMLAI